MAGPMNFSNLSIKKVGFSYIGIKIGSPTHSSSFQIHKLLTSHSVTALDVQKHFVRKIEKSKSLNAFVTETQTLAADQSIKSDSRYTSDRPLSILDGIPIAIKDNFCTKDVRTTCASKMLQDFIPAYSSTVYQRLLDQGCTMMGKTNMDEFGMGSGTIDSIFGPTKNPWSQSMDDWNITGGSSGGSAAAVAAGSCVV